MLKVNKQVHHSVSSSLAGKVLIAGYGSLLSQHSRKVFSNIDSVGIPIIVKGWERAWITRSLDERQTYAGAVPNQKAQLNAILIAVDIDPKFEKREQDYRFTKLSLHDFEPAKEMPSNSALYGHAPSETALNGEITCGDIKDTPVYICESLKAEESDEEYPVHFSYIDTCLEGCYSIAAASGVDDFFKMTRGWNTGVFIDDRAKAKYPRYTPIDKRVWDTHSLIDKYRRV